MSSGREPRFRGGPPEKVKYLRNLLFNNKYQAYVNKGKLRFYFRAITVSNGFNSMKKTESEKPNQLN